MNDTILTQNYVRNSINDNFKLSHNNNISNSSNYIQSKNTPTSGPQIVAILLKNVSATIVSVFSTIPWLIFHEYNLFYSSKCPRS